MLQMYLLHQMKDHQPYVVFQQDGAPPYWAYIVREFLYMHFPEHWVELGRPILWPLYSPDITQPDFFSQCGYIKDIVYKIPVQQTEAQNYCCDQNSYTVNARKHLERN